MKKLLSLLLVLVLALSLSSIAMAQEDWEIVVVPKDASNPWFVRMEVGVNEYAEKTGLNVYQPVS